MWDREDNQEVGLEAAILERVRNSSLVEWFCADNVVGLKYTAEAAAITIGGWVGERRVTAVKRWGNRQCGVCASENAGMSSE